MHTGYGRTRNLLAVKTDARLNDRCRGQESKAFEREAGAECLENMQLSRLAGLERASRSCFGRCYGEMTPVLGLAPLV